MKLIQLDEDAISKKIESDNKFYSFFGPKTAPSGVVLPLIGKSAK